MKKSDALHGHALWLRHAKAYSPQRSGIKFFYISPENVSAALLCGRCASQKKSTAGLMVSQQSLEEGIVTFMNNAAFDLGNLREAAIPLEKLK